LLKDPQTRGAAAYGLERLGEPESAHIIAIYVDETDPVVARQIAMTLGELGGSIAYSALETMQQFWDNKSLVYRTIQESLETLESRLI
jgi:hypothetical protein